ncbi:hypothetical protein V6Z12_A05G374300 [Gossypium hirsutum]
MRVFCWNCRRLGNPSTARELKQLLVAYNPDVAFLFETNIHTNNFTSIRNVYKMSGCLAVSSSGQSGEFVMLRRERVEVAIQSYSRSTSTRWCIWNIRNMFGSRAFMVKLT